MWGNRGLQQPLVPPAVVQLLGGLGVRTPDMTLDARIRLLEALEPWIINQKKKTVCGLRSAVCDVRFFVPPAVVQLFWSLGLRLCGVSFVVSEPLDATSRTG